MRAWYAGLMVCLVLPAAAAWAAGDEEAVYAEERAEMVQQLAEKPMGFRGNKPIENEAVLKAIGTVPRHRFVPENAVKKAYADRPLPIGYGQTINPPSIVAGMTELLELTKDSVVLEVGTGSGYHAAVLGQVAKEVYTIEIIPELAEAAKARLEGLKYENVHVKEGDGYHGWKEHGPYDGIVVTAASSHIPPPLIEQIKPGGRMVIPVGPPLQVQHLMLVEKSEGGAIRQRSIRTVTFAQLLPGKKEEAGGE